MAMAFTDALLCTQHNEGYDTGFGSRHNYLEYGLYLCGAQSQDALLDGPAQTWRADSLMFMTVGENHQGHYQHS